MCAFQYLRICQSEVRKVYEFRATLSYTARCCLIKKQKKARLKCFGHLLSGLATAQHHGRKYRTGIFLSVEVRRRKRREEIGVPVDAGRPHSGDLTFFVHALPP